MSLLVYPIFKPVLDGNFNFDTSGEFLSGAFPALDRFADAHGLTRLTAFADNREIPEDFDGSPDELHDVLGPWDEWFDPTEGKTAFKQLVDAVEKSADAGEFLKDPCAVIRELQDLVRALSVAEKQGAKFRLEMS